MTAGSDRQFSVPPVGRDPALDCQKRERPANPRGATAHVQ